MGNAILYEHAIGVSWTMDESMARTSHALNDNGRVWLIDPVDDSVAIERAKNLGEVVGVVQLLDRHNRDSATLAERFGVPLYVNADPIPDSPFEVIGVVDGFKWTETALWWADKRALVIAEAIGSHKMFTGGRPAGVHMMLRLKPPKKKFAGYEPEYLLVGHGPPIHGTGAAPALSGALTHTRRNIPRMITGMFKKG